MAGNDKNRPGLRKTNKKGAVKGSGGIRRRGLKGKGPTPKAEDRVYHAAHKRKLEKQRRDQGRHEKEVPELVVGRNPVIECLQARVPAIALYIAIGTRNDNRLSDAVQLAHSQAIPLIEIARHELDRMTGNGLHQGIGLQIPPFEYATVYDLIVKAKDSGQPGMIVVLDNITDRGVNIPPAVIPSLGGCVRNSIDITLQPRLNKNIATPIRTEARNSPDE